MEGANAGGERELSEEAEDVLPEETAKSKTIRLEGATYTIGESTRILLSLFFLLSFPLLRLRNNHSQV